VAPQEEVAMATLVQHHVHHHAAVVWVDGWHALVARAEHGQPTITEVDREAEPEHDYLVRVAREADNCDRLMILGPGTTRLAFEHEYADLYRRSDRFVDAETAAPATPRELVERLRQIDPDEGRA
jgi:hypothetical protein